MSQREMFRFPSKSRTPLVERLVQVSFYILKSRCRTQKITSIYSTQHTSRDLDFELPSFSMTSTDDRIAPQTFEPHFTEPSKVEQTSYTIERYVHQVPLDWFLVVSSEIDAWSYEQYLENVDVYEKKSENYSVRAVDFDYQTEPNSDGTGKPFNIVLVDAEEEETKCYPRTHHLLRLLDYDEATYEVVAVTSSDERDGVLVTVQEHLPHVPKE